MSLRTMRAGERRMEPGEIRPVDFDAVSSLGWLRCAWSVRPMRWGGTSCASAKCVLKTTSTSRWSNMLIVSSAGVFGPSDAARRTVAYAISPRSAWITLPSSKAKTIVGYDSTFSDGFPPSSSSVHIGDAYARPRTVVTISLLSFALNCPIVISYTLCVTTFKSYVASQSTRLNATSSQQRSSALHRRTNTRATAAAADDDAAPALDERATSRASPPSSSSSSAFTKYNTSSSANAASRASSRRATNARSKRARADAAAVARADASNASPPSRPAPSRVVERSIARARRRKVWSSRAVGHETSPRRNRLSATENASYARQSTTR
mmetsp:Transcript_1127/g.3590  ORF Transcript_1127/g.3590 Transcript_1127/m.3590 type:complete len:324 (+) Transcript_1127:187-1158(+)